MDELSELMEIARTGVRQPDELEFLRRTALGVDVNSQEQMRERAQSEYRDKEETTTGFVARHSIPFVSAGLNLGTHIRVARAQQRISQGRGTQDDFLDVAHAEMIQRQEGSQSTAQAVGAGLAGIPALVGEAAVGGWLGRGAAGAAPRALGFMAPEVAVAAGARPAQVGLTRAAGEFTLRNAANTALMPSMYMDSWGQRAVAANRDPATFESVYKDLPPAFALGAVQTAILGRLGAAGDRVAGTGLRPAITRLGVRTATGMTEQAGADVVGGVLDEFLPETYQLGTRYGLLGNAYRGEWGEGLKHATVQAVTFAAFSAMHPVLHGERAPHAAEAMEPYRATLDGLARVGISKQAAGRQINGLFDAFVNELNVNPRMGRQEAVAFFEKMELKGPLADLGRWLTTTLPEKTYGPFEQRGQEARPPEAARPEGLAPQMPQGMPRPRGFGPEPSRTPQEALRPAEAQRPIEARPEAATGQPERSATVQRTGEQAVFERMPIEQVARQAKMGVLGAKQELVRRQGAEHQRNVELTKLIEEQRLERTSSTEIPEQLAVSLRESSLTAPERQVMEMSLSGQSSREAAKSLLMSHEKARTIASRALKKLQAENREVWGEAETVNDFLADNYQQLADRLAERGESPQQAMRRRNQLVEAIEETNDHLSREIEAMNGEFEAAAKREGRSADDIRRAKEEALAEALAFAARQGYRPETEGSQATEVPRLEPARVAEQRTFGQPVTAAEQRVLPGGGQENAEGVRINRETALANAMAKKERDAHGLPPLEKPGTLPDAVVRERAMARIARDPQLPFRLVEELYKKPRTTGVEENVILLIHKTALKNEHRRTQLEYLQASKNKAPDVEIVALEQKETSILNQMDALDKVAHSSGTEWGRSGRVRRLLMAEDFSISNLLLRATRAKQGKLTPAERAKEEASANRIAELERRIAELESQKAGNRIQETIDEIPAPSRPSPPRKDGTRQGGLYGSEPREVRFDPENARSVGFEARRLAREAVEGGIREREAVVDYVHERLREVIPEMARRETMDAISGYGDFKPLTKDQVSVTLRDLKGQMQQVAKLEDMQAGQAPRKTGVERREPGAEERRLIHEVNEMKRQSGLQADDPATQLKMPLDTLKASLRHRIEAAEFQLKNNDIFPKERRAPLTDAEVVKLRFDLKTVKDEILKRREAYDYANRSFVKKALDATAETLNLARSTMVGVDAPPLLRQGLIPFVTKPIVTLKALATTAKAFKSKEAEFTLNQEIASRERFKDGTYQKWGLEFTSSDGADLSAREEAFRSRWAEKVPLLSNLGRWNVAFMNRLRADYADAMAAYATRTGNPTEAEGRLIGNFVNVITGRGDVSAVKPAMAVASHVLFAPRYVISRFQFALGQPIWSEPSTARETAKMRTAIGLEYGKSILALGLVYGAAKLAGADVEFDPRSTEFGRIRVGNTFFDPLGGVQSAMVFLARTWTGETKTRAGGIRSLSDVTFGQDDYFDTAASFVRSKLAPLPSTALDWRSGRDLGGRQVTTGSAALRLIEPLSEKDIREAIVDLGWPRGLAAALWIIFGGGALTYTRR